MNVINVVSKNAYIGWYIECKNFNLMSNKKIFSTAESVICTCAVYESSMRSNNHHMVPVFIEHSVGSEWKLWLLSGWQDDTGNEFYRATVHWSARPEMKNFGAFWDKGKWRHRKEIDFTLIEPNGIASDWLFRVISEVKEIKSGLLRLSCL